ncbi:type II toxin-antitoxin system Phd/YefM family antitoxin [Flexivirga sp.]|uniref:type II toxin-antitoxin system Phd/YefM family antitoxin n=1 Tax=Flexivirga sp. TaxID=1962927 RepID=UPI003F81D06D
MKTITVGQLRQNPTAALDEVERGETYVVTRHRREIGRLVPPPRRSKVSAEDFAAAVQTSPLAQDWAAEIAEQRRDADDVPNPWDAR